MADDPAAGKCPKCGAELVSSGRTGRVKFFECGTNTTDEGCVQSDFCKRIERASNLEQQLAAVTEKANRRLCRACLEMHSIDGQCVPHEARTTGQAWFRERLKDLGEQLATVTAERDRIAALAQKQQDDFMTAETKCCAVMREEIESLTAERDRLQRELDAANEYARAVLNRQLPRVDAAACEIRRLEAERDRLRVMAELLEQLDGMVGLPNGVEFYRLADGWHVTADGATYPTARAAISAAMGWEERSGT